MGFFKKIFKPVSKVLDKVIPNEIKPALPYLAAFAPMFGPTSALMGKGIMQRALISGGLNIGAQLAQEGNEGDINLLSAGLGALTGAMTAPGAAETFRGAQSANVLQDANVQRTALQKAGDFGLESLAKGSEMFAAGAADPFSKAGLKAAALPAATATGDLMEAEARRLEKQAAIDAALAEAESLADAGLRGDAIRNAMRAYGFFTDDEIESTVSSAGYRAGGRVRMVSGGALKGLMSLLKGGDKAADLAKQEEVFRSGPITAKFLEDVDNKVIDKFVRTRDTKGPGSYGMYDNFDDMPAGLKAAEIIKRFVDRKTGKINYEDAEFFIGRKLKGDETIDELIDIAISKPIGSGKSANLEDLMADGGRVGFKFGGIDEAIEGVSEEIQEEGKEGIMQAAGEDPMLIEEYNKYVFDLLENRPDAKPMTFNEFKRMVMSGMKDGGLMDLGGKEMDLRGGGFVPIGKKERADDVPARLSKNEFVMTADAVRAAGGGSVNEGAKRMYKVMNDLEARA